MSLRHLPTTLAVALLAATILAPAAACKDDDPATARFDPTTILVKFSKPATAEASSRGGRPDRGIAPGGVRVVSIGRGRTVGNRLAAYNRRAGVVYAEPNYRRTFALDAPNDSSFGSQWGLVAVRALSAWNHFPGSYSPAATPKIAVIDTGVQLNHPDLAANLDLANQAPASTSSSASAGPASRRTPTATGRTSRASPPRVRTTSPVSRASRSPRR